LVTEVIEMKTLVVYGTRYGNTQRVAEAIADGVKEAGDVEVLALEAATPSKVREADLIVVGGPTEAHGTTPALKAWVDGLAFVLEGKAVAAFDTRLDYARVLSGSASRGIEARLRRAGARMVAADGSFLVKGKQPQLEPGELTRAVEWGRRVARSIAAEPISLVVGRPA
jgi:flavodoxin